MAEKRVQFNTVVQNQLPAYVRDEFPLVSEFLKQYYIAQEFQGASVDLIQNIDKYVKVQEITNLNETVILNEFIDFDDTTITVDLTSSPKGTNGFPETYGLLKIDDEIITYTGKTDTSFTGCVRGFSGVSSYESSTKQDELVFESTTADSHDRGSTITNLSVLFLKEFLTKVKHQVLPDIEKRELNTQKNTRKKVHIAMSVLMILVIICFYYILNQSVISGILTVAGYTYGPLLGLFAFGILTKFKINDKLVPYVALASVAICYLIANIPSEYLGGYKFGYELLVVNGLITFLGLILIRRK